MSEKTPQIFFKGFKIDRKKLEKLGYYPTPEDPNNTRYYKRVIGLIPRNSYKYIGAAIDPDEGACLVVVMADGKDKHELQKMEMPFLEEMLAKASVSVLTAGVWLSMDTAY
jgi:hypothetical protein